MKTIRIDKGWKFRQSGTKKWHHATVPGTVHNDLMTHQLIENPQIGLNEDKVQWVEEKDWEYKTHFVLENDFLKNAVIEINFEGLDTYADVFVNQKLVVSTDNMFVGTRVNVKPYLKEGENELRIYFHSPVIKGLEKLQKFGHILPAHNELAPEERRTNVFTRKAPFHYGWDWGPRLVTSGIWRPAQLLAWSHGVISDLYIVTKHVSHEKALLIANVDINAEKEGIYSLKLFINNQDSGLTKTVRLKTGMNMEGLEITLDNPVLWWPNGYGDAYLYDFEFVLEHENLITHKRSLRYGVRNINLVQTPDSKGHTFYFEVNGQPVFMKGANVIPSETLTPSISEETYQKLIHSAKSANMNMLRVWGGAIYEEDYFYQLCDENGLLVWQDFMFACSLQPGTPAHLESIRKEAADNVKRLRNHACLALWCGNNENLYGWHTWGWQEEFEKEVRDYLWKTYEKIFYEILPEAVKSFDPQKSYWPSSPSTIDNKVPDRKSGDEHDWTIWFGQKPIDAYWENVPRFVSEWGMQAFPAIATINSFVGEEEPGLNTPVMHHRQRSRMDWLKPGFNGNDMIEWYVEQYYTPPGDFPGLVYLSQVLQAEAYKTAIEAHRTAMPYCMGSLYWQLNDCWPTTSWSSIDYFFRWKAAHYAVKKAFEPVILTARQTDDSVEIFSVSDNNEFNNAILKAKLMDFYGNVLLSKEQAVSIPPGTAKSIMTFDLSAQKEANWHYKRLLVFTLEHNGQEITSNHLFFARPKDLEFPKPEIISTIRKINDKYRVDISSKTLVKNLCIEVPDPAASYSDNFFDVLPGKTHTIQISNCSEPIAREVLKFRSVND